PRRGAAPPECPTRGGEGARQAARSTDGAPLRAIAQKDVDEEVQREAVEALGKVRGGSGTGALLDIARTHPNPDVRRKAVKALGEVAPPELALAVLEGLARRDPDAQVQQEAVEALGHLDSPQAVA